MAPSTRATRRTPVNEDPDTNTIQNAVSSPAAKRRMTPRKSNAKVDGFTVPSQPQRSGPILDSSAHSQEASPRNTKSNGLESTLRDMMVETSRGGKVSQARSTYDDTPITGQMKHPQRISHVSNNDAVSPEAIPSIPVPSRSVSPFSILKPQIWPSERRRTSWSSQESFGSPPGLPDDKLPKDTEECVRWLTEWAVEHGLEGTLSTDIGPEFASHFASFDADGIEEKDLTPAIVGYDLKSSFAQMVAGGSRRIYSRAVRKWIDEPEQEARKAETEKLVDEKLKEITTHEEEINMSWDFDQKLGYLAGRQNRARLFENTWGLDGMSFQHFDITNPLDKMKTTNSEFQVHLRYLIGGYGSISRVDTIYFEYVTPFYEFLKDLQDQTAGCTIPPRDSLNPQIIVHSKPPKKEQKEVRDTEDSVIEGYGPNELGDTRIPGNLTTTRNGLTPIPTQGTSSKFANPNKPMGQFQPAAARGYTMEHGPWVYWRGLLSQSDDHVPKQDNQWLKIENEDDYKAMVHDLYEANKPSLQAAKAKLGAQTNGYSQHPVAEDPENTYVLFIMHSLDYQEYLNAIKRNEIDKKEDEEWCEEWRNIPKGHDINPGQSWSAYMEEYYEKHPTDPLKFLDEYEASGHGL